MSSTPGLAGRTGAAGPAFTSGSWSTPPRLGARGLDHAPARPVPRLRQRHLVTDAGELADRHATRRAGAGGAEGFVTERPWAGAVQQAPVRAVPRLRHA